MAEYNSNSHSRKDSDAVKKKKVEKVIKGEVITKKKPASKKFIENFISEDVDNVVASVFGEVLVPAMKDTFFSMINTGIEILLYGDSKGGSNRRSSYGNSGSRTSYSSYYDKPNSRSGSQSTRVSVRDRYSLDNICLESRAEAEEVLDCMEALIEEYGMASILDLKDMLGLPTTPTDDNYGWFEFRTARSERTRDGYLLRLPKPTLLD